MKRLKRTLLSALGLTLSAAMLLSGCSFSRSGGDESSSSSSDAGTQTTTETTTDTSSGEFSPMIWKITGEKGNTLYLFGTIHMGDERNEKVLETLKDELDSCDALAVEFDTVAFNEAVENDPASIADLAKYMMYTDGTTIHDHMDLDLYDKCVEYLKSNNNYNALYDYYIIGLWETLLQQTAIGKSPYSFDNAMDTKLMNYCKGKNKEILEVESAEFQFKMEAGFSDELSNLLIEDFFDEEATYVDSLTEMYEAWLSGDEDKIASSENDENSISENEKKLAEDYRKVMLTDRNIGMADKAEEYLDSGKSVFFAVGAAHMVDSDGVVQLMKDRGYTVERISVNEAQSDPAPLLGNNGFSAMPF